MIASREYVVKRMVELLAHPKKKYSQNFLTDYEVVKAAVNQLGNNISLPIIEVGPGLGALSEEIVKRGFNLTAYEIDEVMVKHLQEYFNKYSNFKVIEGDFLKQDLSSFDQPVAVISNIPYQITTPLIEHVLTSKIKVQTFIFMLQKEAGSRIQAKKGSKDYAPLPIFLSYLGHFEVVCKVNRESFIPAPNVDSIILKFNITRERDFDKESKLYRLLNQSFRMRRKTLINNLNGYYFNRDEWIEILSKIDLSPLIRPEELTLDNYLLLLNEIENKLK